MGRMKLRKSQTAKPIIIISRTMARHSEMVCSNLSIQTGRHIITISRTMVRPIPVVIKELMPGIQEMPKTVLRK